MNLISIDGLPVYFNLLISVCILRVSNALLISSQDRDRDKNSPLWWGFLIETFCNSICDVLKRCDCGMFGFETMLVFFFSSVRVGRMAFSRHLAKGERSEMGW